MRSGTVTSAKLLSQEEVRALEARLAEQLGEEVRLRAIQDDSVLSGVKVRVGDDVLDATVTGQLRSLRARALEGYDPLQSESVAKALKPLPEEEEGPATLEDLGRAIHQRISGFSGKPGIRKSGAVLSVGDGIARIQGLEDCRMGELLAYGDNQHAIAFNLEKDCVGAVLLSKGDISAGDEMVSTGKVVSVPVGDALLGRVVNPLGEPIDERGPIVTDARRPIESPAPSIMDRQPVNRPLMTGLIAIDSMVPIGKGQRELIIGDRKTGKTAIAIDTILNQKGKDVLCVYVAIGQKASTVASIQQVLTQNDAMKYTVLVVSTASDDAPMQYIAPYAGCAIAEEWMHQGRDVLIVYDDLSKHAVAYRAMSLLLRRPPGREAYPGDVFYLHSRLLERAAQMATTQGGGSITALPIIETQAGDISAYIPTNVISITDGQLFLESELFSAGVRPAVNVGLSVSRVGGAAQTQAMRKACGSLRLTLSQYRELKVFSQFGSDLDENTRKQLAKGERLTELLKQPQSQPMPLSKQVYLLYAVLHDLVVGGAKEVRAFKHDVFDFLELRYPLLLGSIEASSQLTDENMKEIERSVLDYQTSTEAGGGA